ncbi:hypothetical protein HC752_12990 [Vibrio sp. S9_S30]|uniref:hypothetical protein n=1 Tax=Vibrio sp. S9_S30 TaxID=2720226 RepID=UPI00167FFD70|nr:hypothetical protein [Vibrio sp. S9_S30]MBD1557849.1 hypothetical protein [Vibrio sp. S9_S30]
MREIAPMLIRRIKTLPYPYLYELSQFTHDKRGGLVTQINELAKNAYSQPESLNPETLSFDELHAVVNKNPSSWMFCKDKQWRVQGFVHVQIIRKIDAENLKLGKLDENSISPSPDPTSKDNCIHIGSIVSKNFPSSLKDNTLFCLLAGVADKINQLREQNPALKEVICCDFEDCSGDRHFKDILSKYGFNDVGITTGGDTVYLLNLEANTRPFSELISLTAQVRASHINNGANPNTTLKNLLKRILQGDISFSQWASLCKENNYIQVLLGIVFVVGIVASIKTIFGT